GFPGRFKEWRLNFMVVLFLEAKWTLHSEAASKSHVSIVVIMKRTKVQFKESLFALNAIQGT
ncbi:hypothetical protein, partial [Escherichia coli]|uniref:hypothetical protein n=1 Tax=Escherichia coli TaxID=562 RepID=UPI001B8B2BCC